MAGLRTTNWPDSTFHFSLVCSFVLTDESLCCSLFSYQSGEEDCEPANQMLSLGHSHRILASEKQESIATVSMKKKTFHFICSSSFSFSQSVTLGLPSIRVNLMSRWIFTLSTVVLSKSTHEVAAMYLQCCVWERGAENWAWHDSPQNKVVPETWLNEQTNEQYERFLLPNWPTGTESRHQTKKSTSGLKNLWISE